MSGFEIKLHALSYALEMAKINPVSVADMLKAAREIEAYIKEEAVEITDGEGEGKKN